MSLAKTFYLLKDAETCTGGLYAAIGLSLSVTQPELADLLNELAREEEQHAQQVEMMRCYYLEKPDAFLETPEAERTIAAFVENVSTVRNYFNQHFGRLGAADVVDLALDIERSLVECHQTFIFKVNDQKLVALFANMNLGNNDHIRRLEKYKAGLPA